MANLVHRARKPIEQEALGGVRLVEPVGDDLFGKVIGHIVAGRDDRLHLLAQRGLPGNVGTKYVAG